MQQQSVALSRFTNGMNLFLILGLIRTQKNDEVKALSETCFDSTYFKNELNYELPQNPTKVL